MTTITFHKIDKHYGFLCNDYPSPITIDGIMYLTAEHYIQAHMAKNKEDRITITGCKTPHLAIKARKTMEIRDDWDNVKIDVMLTALVAKYIQHPKLYYKLRDTGVASIIHKSKDNTLGRLLEYVRSK
jgi:hypothetical protein